ncbi:GNAT family N-acetyltransferase [Paraclostridium ghonii]|uniref:Ribosomal protein S18 acetylase RimI-like enzyme n=1 Tax=Paraclostridium ghonii TaxID=29358 RepID=A0ABU0MYJ5_9FIRM|nr:GNAT family N-acetyltransferase [Paeniclostridium ghonii]MDQ0555988.1 ribosomal protein S18 acetylase RimI-like enzyme [Paeniclostridium ghonii]
MNTNFSIRRLNSQLLKESNARELIWNVFLEFEGPDYSEEGVNEFKNFIDLNSLVKLIDENKLFMWGYFEADKIVGVVAFRDPCHVSLLFVNKNYHKRGIASKLYQVGLNYFIENFQVKKVTVNSSPYAIKAYEKLGFTKTDEIQIVHGIKFLPMESALT